METKYLVIKKQGITGTTLKSNLSGSIKSVIPPKLSLAIKRERSQHELNKQGCNGKVDEVSPSLRTSIHLWGELR